MKVDIIRGVDADALLAEDAFRAEWSRLQEQCPWATAFQAPGFACTWFRTYRHPFEPLLVLSHACDGRLRGLLPLAISTSDDRLVVAGHWQAEYQAWICPPDLGDAFPWHALRALRRDLPAAALSFRYLPPGTPISWLAGPEARRTCFLQAHRRPLLRLGAGEEIARSLRKTRNKDRLRLLKRMGPLEFKRITDPAEFEDLFDAVIGCHDARHVAMRGSAPFRIDALKKSFHLALMDVPGLLHVTVLKAGDHLASAHLGAIGNKELQLGLMAYNPWLAKASPGKMHVLFLSRMLVQEGYERLDLTSGGELYKERFANAWDEVHSLSVLPTPHQRRKAVLQETVRDAAKKTLAMFHITPAQARSLADRLKRPHPAGVPGVLLRRARAWIGSRRETRIYSSDAGKEPRLDLPNPIRRDALEDLLAYRPVAAWPSPHEFMSAAMDRIEEGQHVYTYAEGSRLLHFGWLVERPTEALAGRALPGMPLPPDSALVLECYTFHEARGRGLGALSLQAMLRDAARVPGTEKIFIAVPADSGAARRTVEKVGFVYERSLFEEIRFGRGRRWTVLPGTCADLVVSRGRGHGART